MRRRRWVGTALVFLAVLGSALLLWWVRPVLTPFFFAVAIAYIVAPLVNMLHQRGIGRGWAILGVYGVLGVVVATGIWKVVPGATAELNRLAEAIPTYAAQLREFVAELKWQMDHSGAPFGMKQALDTAIRDVEVRSTQALADLLAMGNLRRLAEILLSAAIAPVLAFYMLKDMEGFKRRMTHAIPKRYRQDVIVLMRSIDAVLAGFIRGQVLLAVIVGALAALVTYLLGLRYSLLLGLVAGLTELIPYVGPILGAIPAIVAGLTVSPLTAIQVALGFAIIQQLENAVLSPKVIGERIGLHPLAVLLVVLGGGYLFGPWGLILALPLAGIVRVVWEFTMQRVTAPQTAGQKT